ncbi:hypothetical protein C6Y45_14765 [Alkalicoccus saliphilus]|uniref:Uncharacterized protein n=1 Tax=Alkalicoccus saliphilus TaxID=200989 RepID=A0A2T4U2Z6_9BACI|nr:hypothetical protein C6Y45_14765 [Alkalicoccus saliphilus]
MRIKEYRLSVKQFLRKPYLIIKSHWLKYRFKILSGLAADHRKKVSYLHWLQSDLENKDILVKTEKIEGYVGMREHQDYEKHFVLQGDWDKNQVPIKTYKYEHPQTSYRYQSMENMFLHQQPAEETEEYRHHLERMNKHGESRGGMSSPEDIDKYFNQLHVLYESIRSSGVLSQQQLGETADAGIGCVLDKDGKLLKSHDGHHRYILAEIAGVDVIPVTIQAVSENWVDKNIDVSNGESIVKQINRKFGELSSGQHGESGSAHN